MSLTTVDADMVAFVGLDVSSVDCWAAIPGKKPKQFALSDEGGSKLIAWIFEALPETRIRAVFENTGVYSDAWRSLLEAQGIECAVCNPRRIRHFAISTGQRSKTDKADAKAILAYALHTRPEPSLSIAAVQQQLAFLLRQREKSIKQRVALENQLTALAFIPDTLALVSEQLDQLLSAFRTFEAELDHSIQQLIQGNQDLQVANRILRSMDGVGKVTSTLLCSSLDTILDCNAKQLTALAGLAPAHRESGISVRGKSRIDKQGRPLMRKCLYLAAMAASRSCPHYISVKERMKAAGKPGKVILIAIARQLLLQAQKLLKNHFAANTHPQLA